MTIQSTNAIGPIVNYPIVEEKKASILDEVDELINQYNAKPLMRAEITASAMQLIERFNQLVQENLEQNLPVAREGLSCLLKLGIDEVQLQVIHALIPLFRVNELLAYDVQYNQSTQIIEIEKQVSDCIAEKANNPINNEYLAQFLNLILPPFFGH